MVQAVSLFLMVMENSNYTQNGAPWMSSANIAFCHGMKMKKVFQLWFLWTPDWTQQRPRILHRQHHPPKWFSVGFKVSTILANKCAPSVHEHMKSYAMSSWFWIHLKYVVFVNQSGGALFNEHNRGQVYFDCLNVLRFIASEDRQYHIFHIFWIWYWHVSLLLSLSGNPYLTNYQLNMHFHV